MELKANPSGPLGTPGGKWIVIGCVVLVLLILDTIVYTIGQQDDLSTTARVLVNVGQTLTRIGFVAIAILGLVLVGRLVWRSLAGVLDKDSEQRGVEEVQVVVENNIRGIRSTLARLDEDRASAMEHIQEAQGLSNQLVKVIGSAMRSYERAAERAMSFSDALTALARGKPTDIAQAAGRIEDGQLRTLMLEWLRNQDEAFRGRLEQMVASQLGVVQRNAAAYRRLALQTMPQLADYKVQHERLMAMHDAYDLVEPLLLIDENLRQAQAYLELPMRESPHIRLMPVAMIEAE